MSGLPREVLKWIQGLDLSSKIRNPKWDLANGYIIAEILSCYYPRDIVMFYYLNMQSIKYRLLNWYHLQQFFLKELIKIPEELIDGTMHCKEGAAVILLNLLFEMLTKRKLKHIQKTFDRVYFSDSPYQNTINMHARSTAAKSVKNNLKSTEIITKSDAISQAKLAQNILERHVERRYRERVQNPQRFNMKPTLGERSTRRAPTPHRASVDLWEQQNQVEESENEATVVSENVKEISSDLIKEIQVNQFDKAAMLQEIASM